MSSSCGGPSREPGSPNPIRRRPEKSLATGQCGSATCCAPRPDGVSGGSLRLSGKRLSLKSLILSLRSGRAGPFRTAGGRAAISYIPSEPFRKSKWLRRQVVFFAALFAMVLCPLRVEAHLNSTGLGPVYDGLVHFLLSPEDLVPVLALALFAGLRGAAYGRRALFVLPGAWLLGGFVGMSAITSRGSALTAISFLLLGGLLAADARLSLRATTILAALVGLFHGYLNGAGMGQPGVGAVALLGLVFAVFVLVALAAALVVRLRRPWTRIAVRVVGSWITASGLLMVGWAVRRG